jgi:hypothetical protein
MVTGKREEEIGELQRGEGKGRAGKKDREKNRGERER